MATILSRPQYLTIHCELWYNYKVIDTHDVDSLRSGDAYSVCVNKLGHYLLL